MNDVFCPLAWTTLGMNPHGRIRACGRSKPNIANPSLKEISVAEAWNSNYYRKLRLDMLAGRENPNCEVCYTMEKAGGISKRREIHKTVQLTEDEARRLTDEEGKVKIPPRHLDLRVGNICNLKCVHCWTGNSSKWYEDKLLLDKYPNTENLKINNRWISAKGNMWSYIKTHIKDIKYISFLGGEPFASRPQIDLLKWLIETNNTNLFLSYVTNGTLITKKIISQLEQIKKVELSVSLDAIHGRAEFLRGPFSWENLEPTLFDLNRAAFKVYFNWSAYNANICALPETYEYCRKNFPNIEFRLCCFVTSPPHMSIQNLPSPLKKRIQKKLEYLKPKIKNLYYYLYFMDQRDSWRELGGVLYNYLEDLDRARGTDWRKILPEIAELWPEARQV